MTDKFWIWMFENGHARSKQCLLCTDEDELAYHPTKQMLIGYMIEYLIETDELRFIIFNKSDVIELYDILKKQIESLED